MIMVPSKVDEMIENALKNGRGLTPEEWRKIMNRNDTEE